MDASPPEATAHTLQSLAGTSLAFLGLGISKRGSGTMAAPIYCCSFMPRSDLLYSVRITESQNDVFFLFLDAFDNFADLLVFLARSSKVTSL